MNPGPHVLTHRVDGDGSPLLLLNGGMMSMAAWEPIARRLAARHRVIRCDFRGQLLSPGPPCASMEDHADDVAALLDALGETRVDVVAASFGAYVGLLLAARHPERVHSLVAATVTDVADEGVGEPGARLPGVAHLVRPARRDQGVGATGRRHATRAHRRGGRGRKRPRRVLIPPRELRQQPLRALIKRACRKA